MNQNSSFHDFYVIGLLYDSDRQNLFIQTQSPSGNRILLQFSAVAGWDLSPFEDQNILFHIHEYDKSSLPDWIKTDFNVPKEYLDSLEQKKFFYLEPSIGLGGYIIAGSLEQKTASEIIIKTP